LVAVADVKLIALYYETLLGWKSSFQVSGYARARDVIEQSRAQTQDSQKP
jgi:hypothetical protein